MKKARIKEFDFIRIICALAIAAYHYCCHLYPYLVHPFETFANGSYGTALSAVFFLVSGASLAYNYENVKGKEETLTFWRKRIRSIYPMYFLAFLWFYIQSAVISRSFLYAGNPVKFIFSILGIDGYISTVIPQTYYQVGEWFLGAIIVIYFQFPFIIRVFRKNCWITWGVSFALYLAVVFTDIGPYPDNLNIFSFLFLFITGMMLIKCYDKWRNPIVFIVSLAVAVVVLVVKLPVPLTICEHLLTLSVFIVLSDIGWLITKNDRAAGAIKRLGGLSMAVYLVQHKIVMDVLRWWYPDDNRGIAIGIPVAVVLSLVAGWILKTVTDRILFVYDGWKQERAQKKLTKED